MALEDNEFRLADVPPGSALLVSGVVAVFNVAGTFYATQNECTHAHLLDAAPEQARRASRREEPGLSSTHTTKENDHDCPD